LESQELKNKRRGGEGMNIDRTNGSSFIQSYQNQMQVSKVEKTRPLQKEDQLQISNQAKQMFEKTSDADIARQEKIAALKAQVQNGEYHVNSQKVAEKVHQFWFGQ
jgi:negative regulator of flagellin synthesis FlgM